MAGTANPTGASPPCCSYPLTFTAELIRHCEEGCVPPEVFADAHAALDGAYRRRYVRVNSRCEARVIDAGAEAVLRLQALSQTPPRSSSNSISSGGGAQLTADEVAIVAALPRTEAASSPLAVLPHPEDLRTSSSASPRQSVGRAAPRAVLLRLGLAALTGLPLASVRAVAWLPCGVFSLPWSYAMGGNPLFTDGTLLAMDAASTAAVVALRPRRGERVLDLCCAPGMKLGLLAEAVASTPASASQSAGLAVGVDVSLARLYMTRSTLRKQQGHGVVAPPPTLSYPVCLFAGDGAHFCMARAALGTAANAAVDLGNPKVDLATGLTAAERRQLQRRHSSAPGTAGAKRQRDAAATAHTSAQDGQQPDEDREAGDDRVSVVYAPAIARASMARWLEAALGGGASPGAAPPCTTAVTAVPPPLRFDRVLVDAECSHDGSAAHMLLDGEAPVAHSAGAPAIEKGRGVHNAYRMHHLNLGLAASQPASTPALPPPGGVQAPFTSPAADCLFALQSALLDNGYRQLRSGGTLVYATCSYSYRQNEHVVAAFLERASGLDADSTAVLVPAFSHEHEWGSDGSGEDVDVGEANGGATAIAACVRFDGAAQRRALQAQLDAHALDYGVVRHGHVRYRADASAATANDVVVGSRFWPRTFRSSFLYVAKIWKKPKTVNDG